MLFLRVATILSSLRFINCNLTPVAFPDHHLVAHAVSEIVSEVCEQMSCNSGFSAIISSVDEFLSDTASDVLAALNVPIELEQEVKVLKDRKRYFVLLFIDDVEGFMKFHDQLKMENFYMSGYFIVVFPNGSTRDIELIFSLLWKKFVHNVNIITQTIEVVEMFTFLPFDKLGSCGDSTSVKTNEFDGSAMSWKHTNFFPKKFKDMRGCPIKCGLFHLPPAIIVDHHKNGSVKLHGFDVDVFNELMESINAVVNYTIYPIDTGTVFQNGSGTGLLGHTVNGDVDVSLRTYSLQLTRRKFLSETVSYHSDIIAIIMPLPGQLNPLLKLVRPLSLEAWCLLFVVIVIAVVVILLIKLVPEKYYSRIIGKRMRNEFMNLLIGFLGLSQHDLPEKNFPRYLLMMYLMFCLIVRSLYLGSMFNMLKSDIRMGEFVSIGDFYHAGFNFYIYETLSERLDYPQINARRKIIKLSELDNYSMKTLDPNFKGVVFQYITNALYNNKMNFKQYTFKICKETLMTNHLIIYFRKNFYLVDEMNERINNWKDFGITNHMIGRYADEKFRKVDRGVDGPSMLTVDHFIGMFEVWIFGLSVAFVLFVGEVITHKVRKRLGKKVKVEA